jgi:hypothetical protein
MDLFHKLNTMDWFRVIWVVSGISATWAGLQELMPERYHHKGTIILSAITAGLTLMMRSGKSLVAKAEDKIEEAHDLVVEHVVEEAVKKP